MPRSGPRRARPAVPTFARYQYECPHCRRPQWLDLERPRLYFQPPPTTPGRCDCQAATGGIVQLTLSVVRLGELRYAPPAAPDPDDADPFGPDPDDALAAWQTRGRPGEPRP